MTHKRTPWGIGFEFGVNWKWGIALIAVRVHTDHYLKGPKSTLLRQ